MLRRSLLANPVQAHSEKTFFLIVEKDDPTIRPCHNPTWNGDKNEAFGERGVDGRVVPAHKYSINNEPMLRRDKRCGCFYCLRIFDPSEITEWAEDEEGTALCPYCGIDSVIGESAGYPLTRAFLEEMTVPGSSSPATFELYLLWVSAPVAESGAT